MKEKRMTVKEEYEYMKSELRIWNKKSNWDETKYRYHIERCTKRSQTMFFKLLNSDFEKIQFDIKYGFITCKQFDEKMKVWNECSDSIANMIII